MDHIASRSRALSLTEILQAVGEFLSLGQRANAMQINAFWKASLMPLIYRDIELSYVLTRDDMGSRYVNFPPFAILAENSHHIRSATVIGYPQGQTNVEFFGLRCNFLKKFTWRLTGDSEDLVEPVLWDSMVEFLKMNQSELRYITIGCQCENMKGFWKSLAVEPFLMLKSLSIKNGNSIVDGETGMMIWEACRGLETLELNIRGELAQSVMSVKDDMDGAKTRIEELRGSSGSKRRAIDDLDESFLFPRMKAFKGSRIKSHDGAWLSVMKQCPNLELIQIGNNKQLLPGLLEATTSAEIWPNLNSMELSFPGMTDKCVADLVLSINKSFHQGQGSEAFCGKERHLKSFRGSANVGRLAIDALLSHGHLGGLECLDIFTPYTRSIDLLVILTSCPGLKTFRANKIFAADIQCTPSQPWVCLRLESWDVGIDMDLKKWSRPVGIASDPTMKELQDACLEQLGRLTELRVLMVCGQTHSKIAVGMRLKISCGLEQLARLQKIETISSAGAMKEDLAWMYRHWTKLNDIRL
ncbi:hypothetical protein BGX27_001165 [Mortierella sp. AM989]|nr:hypothetical protein BGX27_001165 [Mortierella sp. AM989]